MTHYGHKFRVLHSSTSQVINKSLAEMELTSAQGLLMGYIAHCSEPPCPRDIEEQFQLTHPTVSGLLARLEKKDFISLLPDPVDRRCKRIHIRPKGLACSETMHATIECIEARLVEGFSPEEKTLFAQMLDRVIANMGGDPCLSNLKEEPTE